MTMNKNSVKLFQTISAVSEPVHACHRRVFFTWLTTPHSARLYCTSFHANNLRRLFRAAEVELRLVALFFAQESFGQRRLRRDDSIKFEDEDEGGDNEWCFFDKKGDGVRAALI
jgi:hypothetical protein